ncbi:MAG: PcfJ domain-containing protein, partial [Limnobacter sp.]|nr:PcfJ domain-containing protein [Limnobacter sp.]
DEQPNLAPLLGLEPALWESSEYWRIIKNRLVALGMQPQTWRWLSKSPSAYVASMDWTSLQHIAWANFHARLGRRLSSTVVDWQTGAVKGLGALSGWVRRNHERLSAAHCVSILRAVRLCLTHLDEADNQEVRDDIVIEEFPLVADWLLAKVGQESGRREVLLKSWTYDTLINRQARWHLSDVLWSDTQNNVYWPEFMGDGSLSGGTRFTELTSLQSLLLEARRMHHCVPSYIDRCVQGEVVLFHLDTAGQSPERATLELGRMGATGWQITQLKGPCNARSSKAMWSHARELLGRMVAG